MIDFEKAFDWIDRDMLMYKLISYNVDGMFYKAIKAMYSNTRALVKVNQMFSNWFDTKSGVRQGDTLSPTLFKKKLNGLIHDIENFHYGIETDDFSLSVLCYADDIVIISENEENLQLMLNYISSWCKKWRKTKVMHVRSKRCKAIQSAFKMDDIELEVVSNYKYLVFLFNEYMDMRDGIRLLSEAAGRSLSGIIAKFTVFRDAGFQTFTKLYNSCVVPISDYFSGIWVFSKMFGD